MSKKATKKLSKPAADNTKEPAKKVEAVYEAKPISEENIIWAIKEIGGEGATVNAIRKRIGQPVFLQLTPRPVWAADQIRAILTNLVKNGKVLKTDEKTKVYTLK